MVNAKIARRDAQRARRAGQSPIPAAKPAAPVKVEPAEEVLEDFDIVEDEDEFLEDDEALEDLEL